MVEAFALRDNRFEAHLPKLPDDQLKYFHPEKWVGEGLLSKWTQEVVAFAQKFDVSTLEGVKLLCTAVQNFKPDYKTPEELIHSYARTPAVVIIAQRQISMVKPDEVDVPFKFPSVNGCLDYSLATAAALRCAGVPAVFTRFGTHSNVHFYHEGVRYEVEPNEIGTDRRLRVEVVNPKTLDARRTGKINRYYKGLDPTDIGMNSILDFWMAKKMELPDIARSTLIRFYGETLKKEGLLPV